MSYYQVAESCRLQTSDWNSKWDLSSLTAFGQSSSSSSYSPISSSTPNQESDFAFFQPKLDQPHEYQHYEKPKIPDTTFCIDNSASFTDSACRKFNGWSNLENRYADDDCIPLTSYYADKCSGYSTHPFIKEEYVDDFIPSGSKVDTTTENLCNSFDEGEYEYMPNQIDPYEWNRNSFNGFSKDEIEFCSTASQFKVSDSVSCSNDLWLMTPPLIKEEYDDDIVLLGTRNTNKDVFGSTASQFKVSDGAPCTKNLWLMTSPFTKEEYDDDYIVLLGTHNTNKGVFGSTTNQFRVNDTAPCSRNHWLMTSPLIKDECEDDVLLLGAHSTHNEHNNSYRHTVFTDNVSDRRNSYVVDEISNDSVELLFERAGLEKIIQSSPSDLLQTKEINDFFSNVQILTQEIEPEKIEVEQGIIPIPFNRRYYKCSHCTFKTNKKERLSEHVEALHSTSCYNTRNTRSRRIQNSVNKDISKFHSEKLQQKSRTKNIKCSECAYTTRDSNKLKQHTEKKHFPENFNHFNSWDQDLNRHLFPAIDESHDNNQKSHKIPGSRLYKCPDCPYRTHRKDFLKKHVKKTHSDDLENVRYTCFTSLHCDFATTEAAAFEKHLKSHHFGEPPFRCEEQECQYKSNKVTAFLTHRVLHTGDRPFNCIECEFKCRRKYHLKGHRISHKKEKNFKCDYCIKKYSYKCSKIRHEKTSCKQKPK